MANNQVQVKSLLLNSEERKKRDEEIIGLLGKGEVFYELPPGVFFKKCRKMEIVNAKFMVYLYLKSIGFGPVEIGRVVGVHHTCITHGATEAKGWLDVYKEDREKYSQLKEFMV